MSTKMEDNKSNLNAFVFIRFHLLFFYVLFLRSIAIVSRYTAKVIHVLLFAIIFLNYENDPDGLS